MRTLKLTVAYDGTNYVGWQRQLNGVSIQQVLEEAFAPLNHGVAPTMAGASRTDAGAHALGQVVSVNTEIDLSVTVVSRALNVRLPHGHSRVVGGRSHAGFHARFHSVAKSYRYRMRDAPVMSPFDRHFVWHAPEPKRLESDAGRGGASWSADTTSRRFRRAAPSCAKPSARFIALN